MDDRQHELAIDDLVSLAIHGRRLIENTKAFEICTGVLVPCASSKGAKELPILRILNTVIHHLSIEIATRKSDLEPLSNLHDPQQLDRFIKSHRERLVPSVLVKSDRGGLLFFHLIDLARAVEKKVLDPIVDYCGDHGLYLENYDID